MWASCGHQAMLHVFGHQSRSSRPVFSLDSSEELLAISLVAECSGLLCLRILYWTPCFWHSRHRTPVCSPIRSDTWVCAGGFEKHLFFSDDEFALEHACSFLVTHAIICVPRVSLLELNRKARCQSRHRCGVSGAVCALHCGGQPCLTVMLSVAVAHSRYRAQQSLLLVVLC